MHDAHILRDINIIGAAALGMADRVREAGEQASGLRGLMPAALISLHHHDSGYAVEQLAGALGMSHSRTVRLVDDLVAAGLAARRPDPGDRRVVRVRLSAKGRRTAETILRARAQALDTCLDGVSSARRRSLARIASEILGSMVDDRVRARRVCRMCDSHACGHLTGDCPSTQAADRAG